MRPGSKWGWLCAAAIVPLAGGAASGQAGPGPLESLARLDRLPGFRDSRAAMVSSYDRTGGNDDGFSGRYSFLRKEGDGLVIADLTGPGVVTRMWTPTPTDDPVEFYFDGETTPRIRIPFRRLFTGEEAPFLKPLSGFGGGGFWTYVPLPYAKSLKVVVRAPRVQFHQVNHTTFAPGTPVRTYDPRGGDWKAAVAALSQVFMGPRFPPAGATVSRKSYRIAPGKPVRIFQSRRGGRIVGLRLGPPDAFAGKARGMVLRAFWDGAPAPAVAVPVGDFFGYSWGAPAARSALLGSDGGHCYSLFPMPYDRSALLELEQQDLRAGASEVEVEVAVDDQPRRTDEGRFYAVWRRENPTTVGKPFTFVEAEGRGHCVAAIVQAQGMESGATLFFEGDDQTTVDGELVAHGTGSEDAFNGGWYDVPGRWEARLSLAVSGCLDYKKHLARTGAYRLLLTDAFPYRKSLMFTIEHAPERNAMLTDYAGLALLYADRPPHDAGVLPPLASRGVRDLDRLTFVPGWSVPIHSFSFERATVAKKNERIAGRDVRYFSMRATGADIFGEHHVAFRCEIPAAGRYRVFVRALLGPDGGVVRLFDREAAVGPAVDLYAAERRMGDRTLLGELDLPEGEAPVFLKLVGKNAAAAGLGMDLIALDFERVR